MVLGNETVTQPETVLGVGRQNPDFSVEPYKSRTIGSASLCHSRHVFPVEGIFYYIEHIQMFRLRPYLRAANGRIAPLL